jgi:hypothetical protein
MGREKLVERDTSRKRAGNGLRAWFTKSSRATRPLNVKIAEQPSVERASPTLSSTERADRDIKRRALIKMDWMVDSPRATKTKRRTLGLKEVESQETELQGSVGLMSA